MFSTSQMFVALALLLVSSAVAQYSVEEFYAIDDTDCSARPLRESYIQNSNCVPSACALNTTLRAYKMVTCATELPDEPGTVYVVSYPDDNCSSPISSVGVYFLDECIAYGRGPNGTSGKFTCENTYYCKDTVCGDCTATPNNYVCADHPTAGSTIYECFPTASNTTTTTGATTGSTGSSSTTTSASSSLVASVSAVVFAAAWILA